MDKDKKINLRASFLEDRSDLVLGVVAKFLTVNDVVNLAATCTTQMKVLKTREGNALLADKVRKEAEIRHSVTGKLLYMEQLPTFGNFSVEESLENDALLVAQLRRPASRRRGLVLLPEGDDSSLKKTMFTYRTREAPGGDGYHNFIAIFNLSGQNIIVQEIDWKGNISRRGPIVPSGNSRGTHPHPSFTALSLTDWPEHLHWTLEQSYHSYAISFEGGTGNPSPFAIYQPRRSWVSNKFREHPNGWNLLAPSYTVAALPGDEMREIGDMFAHSHAIAVLPGGEVKELHGDAYSSYDNTNTTFQVRCRHTGRVVPTENEMDSFNPDYGDNLLTAKSLATIFYGMQLPPHKDPVWKLPIKERVETLSLRERTKLLTYPTSSADPHAEGVWFENNPREEEKFCQSLPQLLARLVHPRQGPVWKFQVIPQERQKYNYCTNVVCLFTSPFSQPIAVGVWASSQEPESILYLCRECHRRKLQVTPDICLGPLNKTTSQAS